MFTLLFPHIPIFIISAQYSAVGIAIPTYNLHANNLLIPLSTILSSYTVPKISRVSILPSTVIVDPKYLIKEL